MVAADASASLLKALHSVPRRFVEPQPWGAASKEVKIMPQERIRDEADWTKLHAARSEEASPSADPKAGKLGRAQGAGHPGGEQDLDAKTETEDDHG